MKPTGSDVVCAALDLKQTHVDVSMQGVAFERVAAEGSDFASPVWNTIIGAAVQLQMSEPVLRPLLQKTILSRASPAEMLSAQLARQLADRDISEFAWRALIQDVLAVHPDIIGRTRADLFAVKDRDPACPDYLHVFLNLKGFQALQAHRIANALWHRGRKEIAYLLANKASIIFGVDIHPAARVGCGIMLDHGSGIVIGETAQIDDNVSVMQNVTLGGTGKEHGDRHPKIRSGVLIGAGAKILGNITVGSMSKIAAGSVVLHDVPPHCTVAGVPARIVRRHHGADAPAQAMDQTI